MTSLREAKPGQETAMGVVVKQNGGQTLMWNRGIGKSKTWSLVNSFDVEFIGEPFSDAQTECVQSLAEYARRMEAVEDQLHASAPPTRLHQVATPDD